MELIKRISEVLAISESDIERMISESPTSYKKYSIPKKNGGSRKIFQPSKATKSLQYVIINLFLKSLKVHDSAKAYKKGFQSPLKTNAFLHKDFNYSVRVDFQDYFPSIKFVDLNYFLKKYNLNFTKKELGYINKIFFPEDYISKGLPIGAPGSPIISNIVMYELDEKISSMVQSLSKPSCYSRYSDDIIFSTNEKGKSKIFIKKLEQILEKCNSPKLKLNQSKTYFMSRKNIRKITGLIITPDQNISIGRDKKRYIRKLIYDYYKNNLEESKVICLKGYLAFILDNEPNFYNKLVLKYGNIVNLILKDK
jgi:RNA-directed DNA polymerase